MYPYQKLVLDNEYIFGTKLYEIFNEGDETHVTHLLKMLKYILFFFTELAVNSDIRKQS